ncbi:MAG: NAD(P)H-binding protein [Terrimonas sp.]|nr:NAD(P)H-binding protein [Terrimonas sp.]
MQTNTFLLYGANGYTGELIARFARQYDLHPVLAGRRKEVIVPLSEQLQLPCLVFDLGDKTALLDALRQVKAVVHAAGPFHHTARQMIEACLATGTHYIDINGDIAVFEMIKKYDAAAKDAGIMLLPGAGFDVVPTDCAALYLKNRLPDAVSLELAFATLGGGLSHGTAMTMTAKLGQGGADRREGRIRPVPLGQKGMTVDFGMKKLFVMSIPWGDISTAYTSTGIPNITTYTGISRNIYRLMKGQVLFNWLLRTRFVRGFISRKINQRPSGPSDAQREKAISLVWGAAVNPGGQSVSVRLRGPEGYTLTAHSCLIIVKKILGGQFSIGYQTPSLAYGEDLVLEVPGMTREIVP